MRRKTFLMVTTVLVLLCTAMIAGASDYYIYPNGSDIHGDGSRAHPWLTVTHADRSGKLRPGDTVHVAPGNYTGPWRTWNTSGTAAAPIAYVSTTKWGAVLHSTTSGSVWSNKANYIEIVNFVVVGNGQSKNGIYTSGANTVIRGNEVHGVLEGPYNSTTCNTIGGAGIQLDGPGSLVIGNYVHNNGPHDSSGNPVYCNYVHGIYFERPGGLAANNMSFDNAGWGIQMWHWASHEVINNNTIFNNGVGCIVVGADLRGPADLEITRLDTLDRAGPGALSFVRSISYASQWGSSKASGNGACTGQVSMRQVRTTSTTTTCCTTTRRTRSHCKRERKAARSGLIRGS